MTNKKRFRYEGTFKRWIGKPDPHGYGSFVIDSDDIQSISLKHLRDKKFGHKVEHIQECVDGYYIKV